MFTDVTSRLIACDSFVGQQYDYDGPQPGQLTVRLDNTDGALDPDNSSSPYVGKILPNRIVRIRAERISGSGLVTLASGYVDSWTRSFPGGMELSETVVSCTDLTKYFARWTNSSVQAAAKAGVHMAAISGATIPAPGNGLDMAATTYTGNQWDNITNLAIADGGLFFIAPDNVATYQTSDYRKTGTRSTTVQETFAFGLPTGTEVETDFQPMIDDRLLANIINVTDAAGTVHTASSGPSRTEYGDLNFDLTSTRLVVARRGHEGRGHQDAARVPRAADRAVHHRRPDWYAAAPGRVHAADRRPGALRLPAARRRGAVEPGLLDQEHRALDLLRPAAVAHDLPSRRLLLTVALHRVLWFCPACRLPVLLRIPYEVEGDTTVVDAAPAILVHLAQHQ